MHNAENRKLLLFFALSVSFADSSLKGRARQKERILLNEALKKA